MSKAIFDSGPVDACDGCGRPLGDEPGFGDVALHGAHGPWGLLCVPCCAADGVRWGWGSGQWYARRPGARWELVQGGPVG